MRITYELDTTLDPVRVYLGLHGPILAFHIDEIGETFPLKDALLEALAECKAALADERNLYQRTVWCLYSEPLCEDTLVIAIVGNNVRLACAARSWCDLDVPAQAFVDFVEFVEIICRE